MKKKKILVVEDYQAIRDLYRDELAKEGYLVDVASDGEGGLEKILNNDYDLILLDLVMPKKGALEVLKELTKRKRKDKIIIMHVMEEEKLLQQAKKLYRAFSINKSLLSPQKLAGEIARLLKQAK